MLVCQAVSGFASRANPYIVRFAHEVVVVDTLGTLAGAYVCEDLRKAAHGIGVNECCAGSVVLCSTNGDSKGSASIMVESAAANATGGYLGNVFGHCSSWFGSEKVLGTNPSCLSKLRRNHNI
ncbi:hypothetical protein ARTHRO9V_220023 [Arthrobacter sp. 9V]|nr:hypothetical protein ARTHRO9V_220023 [Arthrobacter sp. 9V]